MRWTYEQYEAYKNNHTSATAELKRTILNEPLEKKQAKETNSERHTVFLVSYTTRIQDRDNVCPKYHIDALRYQGIIPDDTIEDIDLFVEQVRVKKKIFERTEIFIF